LKAFSTFSRAQWLILIAAICCIGITASLGAWQLRRAAYKEQLTAQISMKNQLPSLANAALTAHELIASKDDYLHRSAQLHGRWRHDQTVFLDNRTMQSGGSQRVGFYVATPLALEGSKHVIWVQRGWVPRDFKDRTKLPQLPAADGLVVVKGRLMGQISRAYEMQSASSLGETQASQGVASGPSRPSQIWQNIPSLDATAGVLLPMALLQTEPEGPNDGLLREWPALDAGVAKHHGYAFQWFALSALLAVLFIWFQIIAPRRHKHAS
jgi:surfeit locus 1 family protein